MSALICSCISVGAAHLFYSMWAHKDILLVLKRMIDFNKSLNKRDIIVHKFIVFEYIMLINLFRKEWFLKVFYNYTWLVKNTYLLILNCYKHFILKLYLLFPIVKCVWIFSIFAEVIFRFQAWNWVYFFFSAFLHRDQFVFKRIENLIKIFLGWFIEKIKIYEEISYDYPLIKIKDFAFFIILFSYWQSP